MGICFISFSAAQGGRGRDWALPLPLVLPLSPKTNNPFKSAAPFFLLPCVVGIEGDSMDDDGDSMETTLPSPDFMEIRRESLSIRPIVAV